MAVGTGLARRAIFFVGFFIAANIASHSGHYTNWQLLYYADLICIPSTFMGLVVCIVGLLQLGPGRRNEKSKPGQAVSNPVGKKLRLKHSHTNGDGLTE